jgi:RND family efflux transporter MFP subunit
MAAEKELLDELRIHRDDSSRLKTPRWLLLGISVVMVLGAGIWWQRTTRAASVRTAPVREVTGGGSARGVLNASGYVTARRRATVSAKITGKVVEVLVEEGLTVAEGQLVGRLDSATQTVNLALAEAQLNQARKALAETEARLRQAEINLRRTKSLAESGVESQSLLDTAQADYDATAGKLNELREEVSVADRLVGVRKQDMDDTIIRAPFSGVVISKDAQPGEMISPISAGGGFTRTGICTVVDMSSLEIEVDVNESYIARVHPRQRVEATLDAYPDWKIPAYVFTTIPSADREKATMKVRIKFDKLDPKILPDMGVKVAFLEMAAAGAAGASPRSRLLVPRAALRKEDGRDVVYVVQGDRLERRAVTLGNPEGDDVVIVAGLSAGAQVVVEGPQDLANTGKVRVQ